MTKQGYSKCPHCYYEKVLCANAFCPFCADTNEVPHYLAVAYELKVGGERYGLVRSEAMELKQQMENAAVKYFLWVDDVRNPTNYFDRKSEQVVMWARDVEQAIFIVQQHGVPECMYLDHDLGEQETVMDFLKWLEREGYAPTFEYNILSANPIGAKSIEAFLNSWKKVACK